MPDIGTITIVTNTSGFENRFFLNNPDITFFKSVYRKHTNFSKHLQVDELNPDIALSISTQSKNHEIKGSDDLLSKIYLENKLTFEKIDSVVINSGLTIFANLGTNILTNDDIDSLSIDIGTNRAVFKSFGLFQEIKGELCNQMSLTSNNKNSQAPHLDLDTDTSDNKITLSCKNGSHYNYTTLSGGVRGINITKDNLSTYNSIETEFFYTIPEFSFMKDYGLALPLIALRNDPIIFNFKFNGINQLCKFNNGADDVLSKYNVKLKVNVIKELIQLDNDEKRRFLTSQLSYLTEHINKTPITNSSPDVGSTFSLCKYILLVGNPKGSVDEYGVSQSTTTPTELKFNKLNIRINGNPLYTSSSFINKGVFTKININKYFPGCGRNLSTNSTKGKVSGDTSNQLNIQLDDLNPEIVDGMFISGDGIPNNTIKTSGPQDRDSSVVTANGISDDSITNDTILTFSLDKDFGQFESIAMIPFAVDPLNYTQPSGCISNSESTNRIILESGTSNPNMLMYAVNYNILQISEGKAQVYRS